jgi:hypothetical protein
MRRFSIVERKILEGSKTDRKIGFSNISHTFLQIAEKHGISILSLVLAAGLG